MSCKYELTPLSFSSVVPSVPPVPCSSFWKRSSSGLLVSAAPCPARSASTKRVSVNSLSQTRERGPSSSSDSLTDFLAPPWKASFPASGSGGPRLRRLVSGTNSESDFERERMYVREKVLLIKTSVGRVEDCFLF